MRANVVVFGWGLGNVSLCLCMLFVAEGFVSDILSDEAQESQ